MDFMQLAMFTPVISNVKIQNSTFIEWIIERIFLMEMESDILEVCVDSTESALAAQEGGASRLELCGNLVIGGTSPSPCLFQEVQAAVELPVHILIRPRYGDFCYTEHEFHIMLKEIEMFHRLGAQGVVIGVLCPDGTLDLTRMKQLIQAAGDMCVTLHRAFDLCADPFAAMEQAKELGIHTILTSGQQNNCYQGKELLRQLVSHEEGRISIMAGGGINPQTLKELLPYIGAHAWHMSGKALFQSPMTYRKKEISMGAASLDEFQILRTSASQIRQVKELLTHHKEAYHVS